MDGCVVPLWDYFIWTTLFINMNLIPQTTQLYSNSGLHLNMSYENIIISLLSAHVQYCLIYDLQIPCHLGTEILFISISFTSNCSVNVLIILLDIILLKCHMCAYLYNFLWFLIICENTCLKNDFDKYLQTLVSNPRMHENAYCHCLNTCWLVFFP